MGRENLLMIAATEAKTACKGVEGAEEVLIAAMRATVNHWLITEEPERLQAAVAAAISHLREIGDEEGSIKIEFGWKGLVALSSRDLPTIMELADEECIPILPQWNSVKEETSDRL